MKKFIKQNKSFRIVIFFVAIILLAYGGTTLCQKLLEIDHGSGWNGTVATRFNRGSGTESSPYHVTNASEFAYIQNGCRNGVYIVLDNDIVINPGIITDDGRYLVNGNTYYVNVLTGKYYTSRGQTQYVGDFRSITPTTSTMSCHIDGKGHSVYGLYQKDVNGITTLFNNFTNGEIKNLNIKESVFAGTNTSVINNATNSTFEKNYFDVKLISEGDVQTSTTLAQKVITDSSTNTSTMAVDTENNGAVNYRYIGSRPNNYICLGDTSSNCANGEKYRIIGVFSDDTHGVTGQKLVKAVRANYIGGGDSTELNDYYIFDAKRNGVGSNNTNKLFMNWSDAQLMYMLNGTDYLNSGYKLGSSAPMHNWTNSSGNISDGTTIFYKSIGSYLYGGGNVNEPSEVTSGHNYAQSTVSISGLNASARDLIQEVTWHTGTASCMNTSIKGLYMGERGANNNAGYCDYWIGKVGMPSVSDVMYATSGGNYGANRSNCINFGDSDSYTYTYECDSYNWLTPDQEFYTLSYNDAYELYEGWTTNWYNGDTVWVYENWQILGYYFNGYPIKNTSDIWYYKVYPTVYLKEDVSIVSGSGTSSAPYILSLPSNTDASSALINNSSGSTYDQILVEGQYISNVESTGFIKNSTSDTVTNIQLNIEHTDLKDSDFTNKVYAFAKTSNGSTFNNMYSSGPVYAKSMYYFNVPATNSFIGNIDPYTKTTIPITSVPAGSFQTVSSSYPGYKSVSELSSNDALNVTGFDYSFWIANGMGYPTLKFYEPDIGIWVGDVFDVSKFALFSYGYNTDEIISSNNNFYFGPYIFSSKYLNNITCDLYNYGTDHHDYISEGDGFVEYGPYDEINSETVLNADFAEYPEALRNYGFNQVTFNFGTKFNTTYITKTGYIYWQLQHDVVEYYSVDANGNNTQIDTINQTNTNVSDQNPIMAKYYTLDFEPPYDVYGYINIDSAPVGTRLLFFYENNIYSYTIKSGDTSIPLSSFKQMGNARSIFYDGKIRGAYLEVYVDFSATNGGTFKSSFDVRTAEGEIIRENPTNFTINVLHSGSSQTEMLTITNNSSTVFNINTVGASKTVKYSFTSTNSTNKTYNLVLNLLDSNENVITEGPISGMSFIYNNHTYRADENGIVVIPIGSFRSYVNVQMQVDYLNSTIDPGTYFIGAKIVDEEVASSYSKMSVKTNYIKVPNFDEIISAEITGSTVFTVGNDVDIYLEFNYDLAAEKFLSASTYGTLYKKTSTDMYSIIRSNIYISKYYRGDNIFKKFAEINLGNSLSPGTYKLKIDYTYSGSNIGSNEVYFIVK